MQSPADDELFEELRAAIRREASEPRAPAFEDAVAETYEILDRYQQGGQATVFKARDLTTLRIVAIKLLPDGHRASLRDRHRFEREVDLAAGLEHPGIVDVHGSASAKGHLFFVMEWIDGLPLDRFLRTAKPDVDAKLSLFVRICDAVGHAHRHGVIHRDLKPANILVDADCEPHVLDFGLAKGVTDERSRVSHTGEFFGTVAYAAPEQLSGRPGATDTRTDVYALGVILYEMLTGELPYDVDGNLADVFERISEGAPKPMPGSCDVDLRTITLQALHEQPGRRYQSVDDLARDLRHYLANEPIEARRDSRWYVTRKWVSGHRRSIAVAIGLVVIAGGIAIYAHLSASERRQRLTSAQVSRLLEQTLSAAGPSRLGADASMPDLLEETERNLQHTLVDAPEVQAALRFTIGDTYLRLAMNGRAVPNLVKARDLYIDTRGPDHLDVARCLAALGEATMHRRDGDAVTHLNRALAIRTDHLGESHPLVAVTKRQLATALQSRYYAPEPGRARALYREALATLRESHGDEHVEVAVTRFLLDSLDAQQLTDTEREQRIRRNLEVFRRESSTNGNDRPLITGLNTLAKLLIEQGRFAEAEQVVSESTQAARRAFGSHRVPETFWQMARFELARRDFVAAEQLYRRALSQRMRDLAQGHKDHAPALREMAERTTSFARPATFREMFALLIDVEGKGRYELAGQMNDVAELLAARGTATVAEALLEDSLVIHCRLYGDDCPLRADNLHALARLLIRRKAWEEAKARLEAVRRTRTRAGTLQTVAGAQATSSLAAVCLQTGEVDRAERLLLEAQAVFGRSLPRTRFAACANLELLAALFERRGESDKAAAVHARIAALTSATSERRDVR